MKCWMARLRARCDCGCRWEDFALPEAEQFGTWIARTRSGFAAVINLDPALFEQVRGCQDPPPPGGEDGADLDDLARWAALVGDPAPNGERYDTAIGPLCPRCGAAPVSIQVDRQAPEVVVSLPLVTHRHWAAAGEEERRQILAACTPHGPRSSRRHRPGEELDTAADKV